MSLSIKIHQHLGSLSQSIRCARTVLVRVASDDSGQDLIEYALVVALIAFAAVAGMKTVSTQLETAFSKIGSLLASALV